MECKKPSLRQSGKYNRDDSEGEMFPELQTQLAEELSTILDSQLLETDEMRSNENLSPSDTEDHDFKLFTTSDPTKCTKVIDLPRKRPVEESSSDSDAEYERLASVAVSGEQVLSGSGLGCGGAKSEHSNGERSEKHKEEHFKQHSDNSVTVDDPDDVSVKKRRKQEQRLSDVTQLNGTETKRAKKHKKRKKQNISDTSTDEIRQDVSS